MKKRQPGRLWHQMTVLVLFLFPLVEVVIDGHTVELSSNALLDAHRVVVGMYDPDTNERLPVLDSTGQKIPEGQIVLGLGVNGKDNSK